MRAALLRSPGNLEIVSLPCPVAGPGQALLRVRAAAVCGSDVHAYKGDSAFQVYPAVLGHEVAGEVVELGEGVQSLSLGDHAVLDPMIRCGHCYPCRQGRYNCCTSLKVMGVHTDGGFADYVAVDADHLYRIDARVPFETAALVEPLCIAAQAVSRGRVGPEDRVLVIGAGTIGLGVLLMAKAAGARVASSDTVASKLRLAQQLGADLTIDAASEDVGKAVLGWTDGDGPSVVIEAVGHPATTRAALDYVSAAGRVVVVGITPQDVPLPIPLFIRKEMDLLASRNSREQFPRVIALVESGRIDPTPIISHRFPLEQAPQALHLLSQPGTPVRKAVLSFAQP